MDSRDGESWDTSSVERRTSSVGPQQRTSLRTLRQRAGSVSHALWPAHMRRSLATGRAAQWRRLLVLHSKWGAFLTTIFRFGTSLLLIATSMVIGGAIVAALLLRAWFILLLIVLLLACMTLIIIPPFVMKLARVLHFRAGQPTRPLRALPHFPGARGEPETPLPSAPLVRVLETYDLSESDVQHFVETVHERDTAELRPNLGRSPAGAESDEETVIDPHGLSSQADM